MEATVKKHFNIEIGTLAGSDVRKGIIEMWAFSAGEAIISYLEEESFVACGPFDATQLTVTAVDLGGQKHTLVFEHRALRQFANLIRAIDAEFQGVSGKH